VAVRFFGFSVVKEEARTGDRPDRLVELVRCGKACCEHERLASCGDDCRPARPNRVAVRLWAFTSDIEVGLAALVTRWCDVPMLSEMAARAEELETSQETPASMALLM